MAKKKQTKKTKTNLEDKNDVNTSRKLTAGLFISLDGISESPDKWQETFDEDMGTELQETLANQDAILLGRKTYEEWSQFWPSITDDPFAQYINNTPKYVVSTTLTKVQWGKFDTISLIKDLTQVKELKKRQGKNIGMSGSTTLVLSLLKANLLDELTLMIHPVIVGQGNRLFKNDGDLKRLNLTYSKTTTSGVIIAKYEPRAD